MTSIATKTRLAARLAVCQIAGTLAGLVSASMIGHALQSPSQPIFGGILGDLLIAFIFALCFSIPFYAAAFLVMHMFTRSILAHPAVWCVGAPAIIFFAALTAFPPLVYKGVFWIALIPLCALFSGLAFMWWQAKIPIQYVG